MSLANSLRTVYSDCLSRRCKDRGCEVKLDQMRQNHVLISGNKYRRNRGYNRELCDFILFDFDSANHARLGTIELKGGDVDEDEAKQAHRQLQNGASIADTMAVGVRVPIFAAFLVKRKNLNSFARRILNMDKYRVTFRTLSESIKVVRSGSSIKFADW